MTENVSKLLKAGLMHDRAGRHDEAAQTYQRALRLDAGNADTMYLLGLSLIDLGDFRGGRGYIERAVKARSHNAIFCPKYTAIASDLAELEITSSAERDRILEALRGR